MTHAVICKAVERLQKKYGERDPLKLCEAMGILVLTPPMGKTDDAIKGFFMENCRIKIITVNGDLPEIIQKIIIAHELGHAILHRTKGVHAFHDVTLFDSSSMMEKEANLFASELLLKDQDVLEMMNSDNTFFTAAAALNVPTELLDFKFRLMKWKGYKIVHAPTESRNNFLKDLKIPQELME